MGNKGTIEDIGIFIPLFFHTVMLNKTWEIGSILVSLPKYLNVPSIVLKKLFMELATPLLAWG